jgi:hypothetical protein
MTRTTLILALGATLLAGAAQANSIESQRNAELAFCMIQANATAGETNKSALERNHDCLRANGWLPQSGTPKILPRGFVAAAAMFATLNSDYLACLNAEDAKR